MQRTIYIILFVFAFWGKETRAQPRAEDLLFKTYAERAELLLPFYYSTVISHDSISVFRKIDSLRQLAHKHGDKELDLEADLMRAHYFYYRPEIFPRARIIEVLDSLRQTGIAQKTIWLEIMAENLLALYNYNIGYYEPAFVHHQRVYNLIRNISPAVFPHKQNCLQQIGTEYYRFNDFRESIFYMQQALQADPPHPMTQTSPRLTLLNTIGLAYQKMDKLDSADIYFNLSIGEAVKSNNKAWECIGSGNLGYSMFLRKQYDVALPLLEKDVASAIASGDWGLASGSQMVIGAISLERHDIESAWKQLQDAREFVYRSGQYNRLKDLYPLLSKLYAFRNRPAEAAVFLDSAMIVKDSLNRSFNSLLLLRARQKVELEQYNAEINDIRNQRRIHLFERNALMAAVAILMIISVVVYREQRKKNRLQKEANLRAGQELLAASRQLNDFARNITEKNSLIEMLQEQKENTATEALRQLQHSTILTDEDWIYFRDLLEKVHAGFLSRLKEKVPGLTPAETRFIALSKLGLSGKEMAATLGIGADAIRQLRSRVRKKLSHGEDDNLEEWINSI